jgi:hypothetical protein
LKVDRVIQRCALVLPGRWAASLIRGEPGHDIIPSSIRSRASRDRQAGKGAFCQTDLELMLHNRGSRHCSSAA